MTDLPVHLIADLGLIRKETMTDAPDYEPTSDRNFTGEAADKLGDATEKETTEQAAEEEGQSPDEPQPATYPDGDDELSADDGAA